MLAVAPKRQFQFVLVWKLDRFSRNRLEAAFNRQKLKKHGVKLVSVKENITDAPEGIIMEGLLESMAEYYSASLSQNIKRGMRESYLKGLYAGGQVPFGYKLVEGKLLQDEVNALIVRYIFEEYAGGTPKKAILTEDEIKAWLKQFAHGDHDEPDFRKWLIDALVNAVYLFDGYMIIFFNLKGTKKVCFQDVDDKLDDMALSQELKDSQPLNPGSDFIGSAPAVPGSFPVASPLPDCAASLEVYTKVEPPIFANASSFIYAPSSSKAGRVSRP